MYAYDLMNEPHDMGAANWKLISQAALAAIRSNGDNKLVMVPGNNWSPAHTWAAVCRVVPQQPREWWGSYALSVQPAAGFTEDRPQLATLPAHLAPRAFTSVSAASGGGITIALDSLVSGYGQDLGAEVELTDSAGAKVLAPVRRHCQFPTPAGSLIFRASTR